MKIPSCVQIHVYRSKTSRSEKWGEGVKKKFLTQFFQSLFLNQYKSYSYNIDMVNYIYNIVFKCIIYSIFNSFFEKVNFCFLNLREIHNYWLYIRLIRAHYNGCRTKHVLHIILIELQQCAILEVSYDYHIQLSL